MLPRNNGSITYKDCFIRSPLRSQPGFFITLSQENTLAKWSIMLLLISLNFALPSLGSLLSVHEVSTTAKTKLAATALLSVDAVCNLHYVVIIGGYGESSSAYRMIEGKLQLDAIYARRSNSRKGIKLSSFNKNYIVSIHSFIRHYLSIPNNVACLVRSYGCIWAFTSASDIVSESYVSHCESLLDVAVEEFSCVLLDFSLWRHIVLTLMWRLEVLWRWVYSSWLVVSGAERGRSSSPSYGSITGLD